MRSEMIGNNGRDPSRGAAERWTVGEKKTRESFWWLPPSFFCTIP
ncbi:hypothetical protein SLEP1_g56967 [Rubroshorea leprosula]|uniref:Uncharacterized protein n=1 Tax=Rubroshorea leprosula TaxID=152421 RepID=A0AAV5MKA1_9ROSI|nr:hypothetical protein SLEP1_g56967 [Rubroshorea leprosula]